MVFLAKIGVYAFPVVLLVVPMYAWFKGVRVYETFVKGAEEGFQIVLSILPYLVAIFVAISCLRGSGGLDLLSRALGVVLKPLGIPPDILPLLITRPISGSGALAVTGDLLKTYGPDSPMGLLASILQGATDTTFYVVTLYFGSVGVRKTRHALAACLIGDFFGFLTGFLIWRRLVF
ncbi:MAG: spore maturation protein [Candidatus Fermentithermobacillus carboniphilus]|uniref:Spore maturation protein n=1 Tax=Candidatus Fermentithermobacillus carboniphilus TaxID=3085328 RepID=A0AAT9LI83_9FIRM|nr:MAG: spore maturation protein [Candidatus Fermentithermobacillus carboniphilus]